MAETASATAVAAEITCGICLEETKDPMDLPCGHSFCGGCLNEWRSRYGVKEEMRRKCPTCRAMIPPSKEMVSSLHIIRADKQRLEDNNKTSSEVYHATCRLLKKTEEIVGRDWDGVTVLQDNTNNDKPPVVMPDYIAMAIGEGDIKTALKWINANRAEDRANAITSTRKNSIPMLYAASAGGYHVAAWNQLTLMTLLLQLGADVDSRDYGGLTAMDLMFTATAFARGDVRSRIILLLSWGAGFFSHEGISGGCSREIAATSARTMSDHDLATLLESELGGRRCEVAKLSSRAELNGKTCVVDEYLPSSNQYKVILETKNKEVLVLSPGNLKRRDRTPQDCGYYIEFKNGRTTRHDFDSSEECQAFVAALSRDVTQPVVTKEAEARAEQAAAELLAELGLDDPPKNVPTGCDQVKKSRKKKKKGGKDNKK